MRSRLFSSVKHRQRPVSLVFRDGSLQLRLSYLGQQNAGSVMASTLHLKCRAEQPKCAKCSGSHETSSCTTAIKRCPNCGGPHSANWQGCPSFKTQKAANYVKATEGLSYAAALTKVKVMQDSCKPIIPKPVQVKPTVPEANTEDPFVPLSQVMGLITKHVPEIICRTFANLSLKMRTI